MGCERELVRKLRAGGFRLTPQREIVLQAMHDVHAYATAEEIHSQARKVSASVDLSTVYRTLDLFQTLNLVSSVDPADGQRRYELLGMHGPHLHLVCRACGRVQSVDPAPVRAVVGQLREQWRFAAEADHLSLMGLCHDCADRAASDR